MSYRDDFEDTREYIMAHAIPETAEEEIFIKQYKDFFEYYWANFGNGDIDLDNELLRKSRVELEMAGWDEKISLAASLAGRFTGIA